MKGENVLLLFNTNYPCWNEELVRLAGEDPSMLEILETEGYLERTDTCYVLTESGKEKFREVAADFFYDEKPATSTEDPEKSLLHCRLALLLDRSFVGRWGIKKFIPGQTLQYYPGIEAEKMFKIDNSGKPIWTYEKLEPVSRIGSSFPKDRKGNEGLTQAKIAEWMDKKGIQAGSLDMDLLFLHYCDFVYYMHKVPPVSDTYKLLHADRFFMKFTQESFYSDPSSLFEEIGKFHLFLFYYRHVVLPGNFDLDIHQQENLNALIFISETEKEAIKFFETYHSMGEHLTGPAKPMDIWCISLESMEKHEGKEDSHFDFFEKTGHRVAITYLG